MTVNAQSSATTLPGREHPGTEFDARGLRFWIDIDYPPQVQYLLPFKGALEAGGADVVVTARDVGITYELLAGTGVDYIPVGRSSGHATARKVAGNLQRAASLLRALGGSDRPHALLGAGRAAVLAARVRRIPSFALLDYEYVHVALYRLTRSFVLHPDVIDRKIFLERGLREDRLIAFRGLKEDLSIREADFDAVEPAEFGDPSLVKVLFRAPAEESHYFTSESRDLTLELMRHLAPRREVLLVFSPRHPWQVRDLDRFSWANAPVVLDHPVASLPLLKGVDIVVSAGGTMLREAAYLGIQAHTVFQSEIGSVDRYLESLGRVNVIHSPRDFDRIRLEKREREAALRTNPALLADLSRLVVQYTPAARP